MANARANFLRLEDLPFFLLKKAANSAFSSDMYYWFNWYDYYISTTKTKKIRFKAKCVFFFSFFLQAFFKTTKMASVTWLASEGELTEGNNYDYYCIDLCILYMKKNDKKKWNPYKYLLTQARNNYWQILVWILLLLVSLMNQKHLLRHPMYTFKRKNPSKF